MSSLVKRAVLTSALALILGNPAFAHALLEHAEPAAGGSAQHSPEDLKLFFSEGLVIKLSGATVTAPDGRAVATGMPELSKGDDKEMIVPLKAPLSAGEYTVAWHAFSKDGHKTQGRYVFKSKL